MRAWALGRNVVAVSGRWNDTGQTRYHHSHFDMFGKSLVAISIAREDDEAMSKRGNRKPLRCQAHVALALRVI